MRSLYLGNRFFIVFGVSVILFSLSFPYEILFPFALSFFALAVGMVVVDILLLYARKPNVLVTRQINHILSLSDENPIRWKVANAGRLPLRLNIYDELPVQFQEREFNMRMSIQPGTTKTVEHSLRPLTRGVYAFGNVNVFAASPLHLIERRVVLKLGRELAVYPSIIQMKEYELRAMQQIAHETGIKKMRRIGHSYEFEQIKTYVEGDDYRSINWKASGRHGELMVNQYEDERSQQVYCIVDKSRVMRMPFKGLSLMDYAINSTLAISNIILKKKDKAGLLSFSDVLGATLKAERDGNQLRRIMESLYREKDRKGEANYELLYQAVRRLINVRSLLMLYTNFESRYALDRALPILRRLNRSHLLVVIFFENTEIRRLAQEPVERTRDIYRQTIARKFLQEKKEMVHVLRQYGIQAILTKPEDLTLNTINKYLELKSRGLI